MPGVLVVIVAFRSDDLLRECLKPLAHTRRVVVDNDDQPTTRAIASSCGAEYLAMPTNVGFAAAVNAGLAFAWDGHQDVLLLNPDAVVDAETLDQLHAALHAPGRPLAAVGPRLNGPSHPQQPAWPMPSPAQVWLDAAGAGRLWRGRRFVTGAVLLLNGRAVAEVGPFDERYFLYAEEADWQLRAQQAGWGVAVIAEVSASHVGAASSIDPEARLALFDQSSRLFARRWYGPVGAMVMQVGTVVAAARRWLFQPDQRHVHQAQLRLALTPRRGQR